MLGQAVAKALGDKRGIRRYGQSLLPMDETLAGPRSTSPAGRSSSGRSTFERAKIGEMDTELFEEFFRAFAMNAGITLHVTLRAGNNATTSPRHASRRWPGRCAWRWRPTRAAGDAVPSTKGVL